MAFHNYGDDHSVGIQEIKFIMSNDAKPRLKWTRELHHRFVKAVDRLGGAEKATPKSLMRTMGIDGLTLYHLKSHLQKYRMGSTNEQVVVQTYTRVREEDYEERKRSRLITSKNCDGGKEPITGLNVTRALHLKTEVQRKLHEQIEVQRHLQLRIEAQGKYLQSILGKAQETLVQYSSCSIKVEQAKAQLSQLLSMVNPDDQCPRSSLPVLTECEEGSMSVPESSIDHGNYNQQSGGSEEGRRRRMNSLMEMHRVENGGLKRKMVDIGIYDESNCVESSTSKELRLLEKIDMN